MPQFQRRNTQPMRADSYRRIARLLRGIADKLDACADSDNPHDRAAITQRLRTLKNQARYWWERHHATLDGTLHIPPDPR